MALPADPALIPTAIAQQRMEPRLHDQVRLADRRPRPRPPAAPGRPFPRLIVWGRQDALVPVAYAEEFGRSIAGSQVEMIDDCGHVMQADQPERDLDGDQQVPGRLTAADG